MEIRKKIFIDEITDNFSDLFIESFIYRYFNIFNGDDLEKDIRKTLIILEKKIRKRFKLKTNKIKVIELS